jgi:hypothetical protein
MMAAKPMCSAQLTNQFNGFFYGDGDHIVTTGHIVNFNGATSASARARAGGGASSLA